MAKGKLTVDASRRLPSLTFVGAPTFAEARSMGETPEAKAQLHADISRALWEKDAPRLRYVITGWGGHSADEIVSKMIKAGRACLKDAGIPHVARTMDQRFPRASKA